MDMMITSRWSTSSTCCQRMCKVELILLGLFLACLFSSVLTSTDTVDASSLLAECTNIRPSYPPPNTLACYRTQVQLLGPFQTCEASFIRQASISTVADGTDNYTIFHLHSPGRLRGRTYVNKLLCRWNIQCPQNQLMYMDIVEHDIEPQRQARLFRRPVCVDYLKSFRDFGSETSCDHLLPHSDLEPGRLIMEFRSNKRVRFPGFNMKIVCFNPDLQGVKGCSPTLSLSELGITNLRNKRSVNASANIPTKSTTFYSRQTYLKAFSSVKPHKNSSEFGARRHRRNSIQQQSFLEEDSTILYKDEVLTVVSSGGKSVESFGDIRALHTYSAIDSLQSFYIPPLEVKFTGRALLTIIQNVGYYYRFGVDVKFKPSDVEQTVIREMLESEEQLVVDQDIIIDENEGVVTTDETPLDTSTVRSEVDSRYPAGSHGSVRGKRQTSVTIDERVINTARAGADSCNAIVRAVAQSLLSLAGEM